MNWAVGNWRTHEVWSDPTLETETVFSAGLKGSSAAE